MYAFIDFVLGAALAAASTVTVLMLVGWSAISLADALERHSTSAGRGSR